MVLFFRTNVRSAGLFRLLFLFPLLVICLSGTTIDAEVFIESDDQVMKQPVLKSIHFIAGNSDSGLIELCGAGFTSVSWYRVEFSTGFCEIRLFPGDFLTDLPDSLEVRAPFLDKIVVKGRITDDNAAGRMVSFLFSRTVDVSVTWQSDRVVVDYTLPTEKIYSSQLRSRHLRSVSGYKETTRKQDRFFLTKFERAHQQLEQRGGVSLGTSRVGASLAIGDLGYTSYINDVEDTVSSSGLSGIGKVTGFYAYPHRDRVLLIAEGSYAPRHQEQLGRSNQISRTGAVNVFWNVSKFNLEYSVAVHDEWTDELTEVASDMHYNTLMNRVVLSYRLGTRFDFFIGSTWNDIRYDDKVSGISSDFIPVLSPASLDRSETVNIAQVDYRLMRNVIFGCGYESSRYSFIDRWSSRDSNSHEGWFVMRSNPVFPVIFDVQLGYKELEFDRKKERPVKGVTGDVSVRLRYQPLMDVEFSFFRQVDFSVFNSISSFWHTGYGSKVELFPGKAVSTILEAVWSTYDYANDYAENINNTYYAMMVQTSVRKSFVMGIKGQFWRQESFWYAKPLDRYSVGLVFDLTL